MGVVMSRPAASDTVVAAEPALVVENLHITFQTRGGSVLAVRGLSIAVGRGEIVGLVGESGSGKSVTSLAIMGLLPKSAKVTGSILVDGQQMIGLPEAELRKRRGRSMSMIFQDPYTALNPIQRIGDQLLEAIHLQEKVGRAAARSRMLDLLRTVGIPDPDARSRAYPHQFSGGMRQRVMIAIAIAGRPSLLIADEPTTALDVTIQAQIVELLITLRADFGMSILLVTHNLGLLAGMADRVAVAYAGQIDEHGPTSVILKGPRHPYTQGLLRSVPRPDLAPPDRLIAIPGAPPDPIAVPSGCAFQPRCPHAIPRCLEMPALVEVDDEAAHHARCFVLPRFEQTVR